MNTRPEWRNDPTRQNVTIDACAMHADDPIVTLARDAVAKVLAQTRDVRASQKTDDQHPSPQITELARALVDADQSLADEMIADLLRDGVGIQDLCLDHLAPVARVLGASWESDQLQFADVSLATARIQAIIRTMPATPVRFSGQTDDRAHFAAVPGETHTLGVVMAADHFRRLGWDVSLLIGMDHGDICRRIQRDDCNLVGLSCAGRHAVPALSRLVTEIRHLRPDMGIVLGGHIVTDTEAVDALPQLDGLVDELEWAERVFKDATVAELAHQGTLKAS